MNRELKRGKQENGGSDVPEKVVVAVKASKEIPKSALVWALTHVVQSGDSVTLLVLVQSQSSGRRFWGFGRFTGGCASGNHKSQSGATLEQRSDITDSCTQMIRQLHDVYDPTKVNIKIKIVSGSPRGAVADETKRAHANWVVLDKQLKHEAKRCMEELQCNIVEIKHAEPKILRLNLVGRSKETEAVVPHLQENAPEEPITNNNVTNESIQGQIVTEASSPEPGTPFTATEPATSSASSDRGSSPLFVSETGRILVGRSKETEAVAPPRKDEIPKEHTESNAGFSKCIRSQGATPTSSPKLGTPSTATEPGSSLESCDSRSSPFSTLETNASLMGKTMESEVAASSEQHKTPEVHASKPGSPSFSTLESNVNLEVGAMESEFATPLGQDKLPEERAKSNRDSSECIRDQLVTATSSPELENTFTAAEGTSSVSSNIEGSPFFTATEGTLSVSSHMEISPFFVSESNRNPKESDSVIVEDSRDLDESSFDSESEVTSAAASRRFEPSIEGFLKLQCQSSVCTEEGSQTSRSAMQSQTTKVLLEKFSKFDRQTVTGVSKCRSNLEFNGTVREAVSLSRNVPPGPPPLCSICQHKAPVFGNPPRWFSYTDLELATAGFSQANFLAEGGFGSVHRGVLPDGQVIAVKQHKLASSQGDLEFCSEVEVLSRAQHRNVVMLIGFCIEDKRRLLVYEYVCNGSLDCHLYGHNQETLEWPARQKIAVGAARGLRYLHEECRVGCIIHRDMRPNNILVTHDFEPLVGDFGLARWQPDGDVGVATRVIGTFGYLAPEYAETGQITEKADVYSFGVVLVELVTGRKAVDLNRPKGQQCLTEWARPLLEAQAINELIDPRLGNRHSEQEVYCMLHAASLCIRRDPQKRPRMSQVLRVLEGDMIMDSNSMITTGSDVGDRSGRMHTEQLPQHQQQYANPLWYEVATEASSSRPSLHIAEPFLWESDAPDKMPYQDIL